jgi:TPR repeat protein
MSKFNSKFLAPLAVVAAFAAAPAAHAQDTVALLSDPSAAVRVEGRSMTARYAEGVQLRAAGDKYGAYRAFHEAAVMGHPTAQRRLGEIYDSGDAIVQRDYAKALRWYQAAREGGEVIPVAGHRGYGPLYK